MHRHATVTMVHRRTPTAELERSIRGADIVVSAAGQPQLISGQWIKPGAAVLDVGITRLPHGALAGDVQFGEASKVRLLDESPLTVFFLTACRVHHASARRRRANDSRDATASDC